jgi:Uma2 family endonuclease
MGALMESAHVGLWTVEEWLQLNESSAGNRYELFDGSLFVSPSASTFHQYAADELRAILNSAAPDELAVVTAVGIQLGPNVVPIPDLVVLTVDGFDAGTPVPAQYVRLAVEVVSPGSTSMDRVLKPAKYAAAGVERYWRVELDSSPECAAQDGLPALLAHVLDGSSYRLESRLNAGTRGILAAPFEVELDPADLVRRRPRARAGR